MMMSVVIAMMVAALMILRTAAYPEPPTSTPTPPSPCPSFMFGCPTEYCRYKTIWNGCMICYCPEWLCTLDTCFSSQDCQDPYHACFEGRCYYCNSKGPTIEPTTPPTPAETPTTPTPETPTTPTPETPTTPTQETPTTPTPETPTTPTPETPTTPTPETPTTPTPETPTTPTPETPTPPTPETPTWTTPEPPTPPPCPEEPWCRLGGSCSLDFSQGGECPICTCYEPICLVVVCPQGTQCVECIGCPDGKYYDCISTGDTPMPPTPTVTTPCSMVTCGPDCVLDAGSDGCPACECPPSCKTVKCSAGYECQLVNVTCFRFPCFPQPQCVPVEDPCAGTPNPGRCGRGSKTRWTYNSLTGTCESFRYFGCTPSLNTFRSRKECRRECSGNSQIVCSDLACAEDSCYTLERKNKCPLCICPNPCKEIHCRKGYECKMRESKCNRDPKPFCAKKP